MKPTIVVTRVIDQAGLAALREVGEVDVWEKDEAIPRSELLKRIQGADAVVTLLTEQVDAEFFDAAGSQLRIVANHAIGYDNVDVVEAKRRGVVVTNTPAMSAQYVAEHALGLALAVGRRIVEGDQFVRAGRYHAWAPLAFLGQSLWGRTLGILGSGQIGHWLAELAHRAFDMNVLYYDIVRNPELETKIGAEFHTLDVVLKRADLISLHVPLLDTTQHLIGAHELSLMKPTAILINTARGPVVDEAALYDALRRGKIAGAGLDVYEHEPKLHPGLAALSNVVLTPHIASAVPEARRSMALMAAENVANVLAGKPPVTPAPDPQSA